MKNRWAIRRELQARLIHETGCTIQHTGWCCNTCFHAIELPALVFKIVGKDVNRKDLNISAMAQRYQDRIHEYWQSVLLFRGDYTMTDIAQPKAVMEANIIELLGLLREKQGKVYEAYGE